MTQIKQRREIIGLKQCSTGEYGCGQLKPFSAFNKNNGNKANGLFYICRSCQSRAGRIKRAKPGFKETKKAYNRAHYQRRKAWYDARDAAKDPRKVAARAKARHALKMGVLVAPACCQGCADPFGDKGFEMHHENYSKPLAVHFLCRPCHRQLHGRVLYRSETAQKLHMA